MPYSLTKEKVIVVYSQDSHIFLVLGVVFGLFTGLPAHGLLALSKMAVYAWS